MQSVIEKELEVKADFLPLHGTDHVEFYVGNAKQASHFYRSAFGMHLAAYCGPETGVRNRASYVLEQGKVRFVLTTALHPDHPEAAHVNEHGDSVKVIALLVDDAAEAWRQTTSRGGESIQEPRTLSDAHGEVKIASIATYGHTIHTFVERRNYTGAFM